MEQPEELVTRDCLGCGFCCRKSPCFLGEIDPQKKYCKHLVWNGEKWRCELILKSKTIGKALYAGEGCCSDANTYQRYKVIPTPEDLKDESALLRRITRRKKCVSPK